MTERSTESLRVLVLARRPFQLEGLGAEPESPFNAHLIRRPDSLEEAIDEYHPDVLLVDTEFPDRAGIDAISEALVHAPDLQVLALVADPPPHDQVALAARAGASGFIDVDAPPSDFAAAISAASEGDSWFPPSDTEAVLRSVADDLDTTAAERRSRLTGMILALVPITGLIAAVQTRFWRAYVGRIGVRPVDLAVDPASRVIDALVVMLLVIGFFGPLLFVGNWLDLLRKSKFNRGWFARFLEHRKTAHLVASLLWLAFAWLLAQGVEMGLVVVVGPVVTISIFAKVLDANDEIPKFVRITGVGPGVAVAGAFVAFIAFFGLLSYEVFIVGPDLRTDGEHGYVTPRVLGLNAQPVKALNIDTDEVHEYLYLGGTADVYVLVDPCDDDRVDFVSVGTQRLTVIDEVTCPDPG